MANIYIHHQYRYTDIIQNENNVLTNLFFFWLIQTNGMEQATYIRPNSWF